MITVPEKIQYQISDALTLIASSDFPNRWEGLLPVNIYKDAFMNKRELICIVGIDFKAQRYRLYCQQRYSQYSTFDFQEVL